MQNTDTQAGELAGVEVHGVSRQSFILKGALAAGVAFGATAVSPFVGSALAASTDADILNFALTLEYLETNFYKVKGSQVGLSGTAKSTAKSFGDEEMEHVTALTAAIKQLGGKPVAMPKFNFPVTDEHSFLKLAYTLENLGVAAYNGAGPMIKSKAILGAAGSIVQVEARHAATIGVLTKRSPVPNGAFDKPMTANQVLAKAKPLIASS
jgi:hypothetical protein